MMDMTSFFINRAQPGEGETVARIVSMAYGRENSERLKVAKDKLELDLANAKIPTVKVYLEQYLHQIRPDIERASLAMRGKVTIEEETALWEDRILRQRANSVSKRTHILLARTNDQSVGIVHWEPASEEMDEATIWSLATHPGYWGQGIGTALVTMANVLARLNGFPKIDVISGNDRSTRLYERMGFQNRGASEMSLSLLSK